jgi:WXG100 family type VII secretion target
MARDTILVNYEQLEDVTQRFQQQAEQCQTLLQRLRQRVDELENNGWQGDAAQAFFRDVTEGVFPALQRLGTGLEEGAQVAQQIGQIYRHAEEDISQGQQVGQSQKVVATTEEFKTFAPIDAGQVTTGADDGIPPGGFTPEQLNAFADLLIHAPGTAKRELESGFDNPLTAELLRQLAAWAASENADPKAAQAYRVAFDMLKDSFDNDATQALQRRFTDSIAKLQGPGAGAVKGEMALHIMDLMQGFETGELTTQKFATLYEGVRHIEELALGPEGEQMLAYLGSYEEKSEKIRTMFDAVITYDTIHGDQAVGEMLGRYAHAVASTVQSGDSEIAEQAAKNLGRVVASTEMAIYDTQPDGSEGRSAVESVEHGAGIIRGALGAIDSVSGGVSAPFTAPVRQGVGLLESYEKELAVKEDAAREKALRSARSTLRDNLIDTVYTTYESVLDPGAVRGTDPRFMKKINDYRRWVSEGRLHTLENAGYVHQISN